MLHTDGAVMEKPLTDAQQVERVKELLARVAVIKGACELDLLVFLHRHPRTLLTNEQLALVVGHDMKLVAKSLDTFIDAGIVERTQNPMHAARLYLLVLDGPQGGGLKVLLEWASTRHGRQSILQVMNAVRSRTQRGATQELRRVQVAGV